MKLFKYLPITFLIAPMLAFAGPPMKSPACSEKITVRAPRGGAGVFFDDTCEAAYVLPPAFGQLELAGLSSSASVDDCTELKSLEVSKAQLADRIARLTKGPDAADPGAGSTIGGGGGISQPVNPAPNPGSGQDAAKIAEETNEIMKSIERLREATKYFSETEGMSGKLIYSLDHEGMRDSYAKLNPAVKNFVRLNLDRAYLTIAPKSSTLRIERSPILDYSVPGLAAFPREGVPPEDAAPNGGVYFGQALSGNIRMTVKAACELMNGKGKSPDHLSASQLEKYMAANITYSYGLNVKRSYVAEYDLRSLVERIEKSTKSGGFFSSSTVNELIQRNESNSWFHFKSISDDERFPIADVAQQIKAEIIDRVLSQIAMGSLPGSGKAPPLTEPGPKGVDVAASGLKKCPYAYCQVAGYFLDFVGATFGRSTAVSNFLSTITGATTEVVEESKSLHFLGTSTFKDAP